MSKRQAYLIIGTFPIAGKQPGERLTAEEAADLDVATFIEAGLITPTNTTPTEEQ